MSKPEQRVAELIDEAENIRDATSAASWFKSVRSFLVMVGDHELSQDFEKEESLLHFLEDVEEDGLRDAVNVLKNYAATQIPSGD